MFYTISFNRKRLHYRPDGSVTTELIATTMTTLPYQTAMMYKNLVGDVIIMQELHSDDAARHNNKPFTAKKCASVKRANHKVTPKNTLISAGDFADAINKAVQQ